MKSDYTDENFEDYLKQSADSLRMRAPDKIWKSIQSQLSRRRRRMVAGGLLLLLLSGGAGYLATTTDTDVISVETDDSHATPVIPLKPSATVPQNKATASGPANSASATIANKSSNSINTTNSFNTFTKSASANNTSITGNTTAAAKTKNRKQARVISFGQVAGTALVTANPQPLVTPGTEAAPTESVFTPTVVDSDPEPATAEQKQATTDMVAVAGSFPLTIESVTNTYKRPLLKRRLGFQVYISPTISYRKLTENKSYLRSAAANGTPITYAAQYGNVANAVTHKPDVGFELGLTTRYPASKQLTVLAGFQFNVNRYDVRAFSASTSVATIALNSRSRGVDSLNAVSGFSNVNGYKTNWLQNFYFQVSAPIGAEYRLKTSGKANVGFAATIQPTYIVGDRAYLISTDYKNYALVPSLIRRWNVNTAFSTFVTINSGNTRWQVGPQVRYQLLSSFINEYPVKENLFDFGLKLGLSLNKY